MILPVYRAMYHDEMMYGWLSELGKLNYPDDPYGMQRAAKKMLRYAYPDGQRYRVTRTPFRKDCMRGLGDSLAFLRREGYAVPETWDVISYNMTLGGMGICRRQSAQARYLYTALSAVYGDLLDMPAALSYVGDIQVCPACMKEQDYIRTWHQFPGVSACCRHGIKLMPAGGGSPEAVPADDDSLRYAAYVKDIYDSRRPVFLDDVRAALIGRASAAEVNAMGRPSMPFKKVVEMLVRYGVSYSDIPHTEEPPRGKNISDGMRDYRVLSAYGQTVTLECPDCGRVFTTVPYAVESGLGCPDCLRSVHPEKAIAHALRQIGDGNYRLDGIFRGMGAEHDIVHDTCGKKTRARIMTRLWDRRGCTCEMSHTIQEAQEKVDSVADGFTVIDYRPSQGMTRIRHEPCGREKMRYLPEFCSRPGCAYCRNSSRDDSKRAELASVLGGEYEYVRKESRGRQRFFYFRHRTCGTVISGTMRQFLGGRSIIPRRCPVCTALRRGERRRAESAAGRLCGEMSEWFKTHKTWVVSQHREYSGTEYYNAMADLKNRRIVYNVAFGIYAQVPDVDVFDVLREKYLVDAYGRQTGRFTGSSAAYLAGREPEPALITLETTVLKKHDKRTMTICGRKVAVKGADSVYTDDCPDCG